MRLKILFVVLQCGAACLTGPAVGQENSWRTLPRALECARDLERPLLVYVYADWCAPCRRMEREVFPFVQTLLSRFARAGVRFEDAVSRFGWDGRHVSPAEWASQYGIRTTPTLLFLNPDGTVVARSEGYLEAPRLALLLAWVSSGAHRFSGFSEYESETPEPRLDNSRSAPGDPCSFE